MDLGSDRHIEIKIKIKIDQNLVIRKKQEKRNRTWVITPSITPKRLESGEFIIIMLHFCFHYFSLIFFSSHFWEFLASNSK